MATQVDYGPHDLDGMRLKALIFKLKLITSGTTVTISLPAATRVVGQLFHNITTDAFSTGGTYDEPTGVWTSPTMAVNDECRVALLLAP